MSHLGLANSNFINSTVNIRFENVASYNQTDYPTNVYYAGQNDHAIDANGS